jgi:hypothetical protein
MTDADRALARQALVENDWDRYIDTTKLIQLARADEREACAKVAEWVGQDKNHIGIAAAIRARGQA